MLPNWLIGLILFTPFLIGYVIVDRVEWHREQSFLKAVFDGDRIWNDKRNRKRNRKLTARHGRFYS